MIKQNYNVDINIIPMNIAIYKYDIANDNFIFVDINNYTENSENIDRDEVLGKYLTDIFPNVKEFGLFDLLKKAYETGKKQNHKATFYSDDRIQGWQENEIYKLENDLIITIYKNINAEKLMETDLKLYKQIVDTISEAVIITDMKGTIIYVNPAYLRITGYSINEVIGKNPRAFSSGKHNKEFYKDMWLQITNNQTFHDDIWDKKKDGTIYPKRLTINTVKDLNNKPTNYVGVFTDVAKQKKYETNLKELAFSDGLTKLPNRIHFHNILKYEVNKSSRGEEDGALLLLDLDKFKIVNDTLGHQIGDELLIQVAKRLQHVMRQSDMVSRIGGDEFTIILSAPIPKFQVEIICQNIIKSLSSVFTIDNNLIYINSSIGVAFFNYGKIDIDELIRQSDVAMYKAKSLGRGNFQFYNYAEY